ncbi:MAG: hypothetical protein Hyperionvirus45_6 [Hyperionvirus sp.]|uniref:Uncharacterized protein n=1 Tax=Hyperionvirus sp. TaxID=2487770 RepID=A0A3G5ACH4_9VIRU|nr:MAG: hypothetical protein Hyperionvirus45_6 [Hyperionvirus sp.]
MDIAEVHTLVVMDTAEVMGTAEVMDTAAGYMGYN